MMKEKSFCEWKTPAKESRRSIEKRFLIRFSPRKKGERDWGSLSSTVSSRSIKEVSIFRARLAEARLLLSHSLKED